MKEKKPISAHGEKVRANRGKLFEQDDAAFEVWMASGRNYRKAAEKLAVNRKSLEAHASKKDWKVRAAKRTELIQAKTDERLSDRIARDNVRLYDTFGIAHRHAEAALNNPELLPKGKHLRPIHLVQVTEAMEKVTKSQRLIAGESTDRPEVTVKDFTQLAAQRLRDRAAKP